MQKLLIIITIILLSGCASVPIPSIALDKTNVTANKSEMVIGMVTTPFPKIGTTVPGAGCLLCLAVAKGQISDITRHVKTLESDIDTLDTLMLNKIRQSGFKVKVITDQFDLKSVESVDADEKSPAKARHNFKPMAAEHGITHLLVLNIRSHGIVRNYANYVPTSPPFAAVYGSSYLVDLSKNEYVWFEHIKNTLNAEGQWKTPPAFPELTNAYYSVLEMTKDSLQEAFDFENIK